MEQSTLLLWGLMFGVVGYGFFSYGRKQHSPIAMLCGVSLLMIPYLIHNTDLLIFIAVLLCLTPFFAGWMARRFF